MIQSLTLAGRTIPFIDTWLAVASRREVREYADRDIPEDVAQRILDGGRLAGSSQNRQPWRFLVVEDPGAREQLAEAVYAPANVRGARLIVAVVGRSGLDTGRAAQNMMLVAWNEGVGSCPNGIKEPEQARAALRLGAGDELAIVLTFGYPARERDPLRHTPEEWSARADRKPLDELVERL
jgi:nitroreductase